MAHSEKYHLFNQKVLSYVPSLSIKGIVLSYSNRISPCILLPYNDFPAINCFCRTRFTTHVVYEQRKQHIGKKSNEINERIKLTIRSRLPLFDTAKQQWCKMFLGKMINVRTRLSNSLNCWIKIILDLKSLKYKIKIIKLQK